MTSLLARIDGTRRMAAARDRGIAGSHRARWRRGVSFSRMQIPYQRRDTLAAPRAQAPADRAARPARRGLRAETRVHGRARRGASFDARVRATSRNASRM
ncbi:hypothetical protein LGN04_15985 [Burkholderia multivorans]|nr:hypothetical protein [Burkholderia multivorans]